MCLNPITMRNPAKDELGGMEYIQVPCRHCSECADVMSNDYVVRTIALINSLRFYSFFFCTLTFNEESVPRTTIYKLVDGDWQPVEFNVRCFNHELYRRFRKNFSEWFTDRFHKPTYILTTCEFGEHSTKRPHYHCIICVPCPNMSWLNFKHIIEKFWHYGFTKDVTIAMQDGIKYKRSLINCVKYVTKYVSKFNTKLPYYLLSDKYCTDYPPCEIRPRVFISKGYGASLSSLLTHSNYKYNSVVLEFDGKKKNYSIPQYYLRKYFTRTEQVVIDAYYPAPQGYPYDSKLQKRKKYRRKSKSYRINGYDDVLFYNFKNRLKTDIFHYNHDICYDECLRSLLPTLPKGDFEESEDWSLSPTFFDEMCTYYLQAKRPSPLSLLPLSPQREDVIRNVYFYPCEQEKIDFYQKYHLSIIPREFGTAAYLYAKRQQRKHGLPWFDMRCIPFKVSRPIHYNMPPDYSKLEFYLHYKRNLRLQNALNKHEADIDWLNKHHKPYV